MPLALQPNNALATSNLLLRGLSYLWIRDSSISPQSSIMDIEGWAANVEPSCQRPTGRSVSSPHEQLSLNKNMISSTSILEHFPGIEQSYKVLKLACLVQFISHRFQGPAISCSFTD
jgi:hypothetical protein